jgi:hypothetical protein
MLIDTYQDTLASIYGMGREAKEAAPHCNVRYPLVI